LPRPSRKPSAPKPVVPNPAPPATDKNAAAREERERQLGQQSAYAALGARARANPRRRAPTKDQLARMFGPAIPPPGVLPDGITAASMAMDSGALSESGFAGFLGGASQNYYASAYMEGQQFLGYGQLALMAQRAEYRVITDTLASDMTREWISFEAGKNAKGDKSRKIAELEDYLDNLGLKAAIKQGIEYDGFQGRGQIYIDLGVDVREVGSSTQSAKELSTPIGNGRDDVSKLKIKRNSLKRLQPIEPMWTYPYQYNASQPLREDWYRPESWYVMGTEVNRSRLITFVGRPVPDMLKPAYSFGGLSMTQMAKPYVDFWLRDRTSASDLLNGFSTMVLMTTLDTSSMSMASGDMLFERIRTFNDIRDNLGLMVLNKATEDFKNVSASLGGVHELVAQAQEHVACLPGETLVETDRGQVAIRDVRLSDKVMTRQGWAPLAWSGVTGYADDLIEIETSSGTIRPTSWHPIFSPKTSEFVPAESVQVGECLLASDGTRTNTESHLFGVGNGGIRRRLDTIDAPRLIGSFMTSSGKRIAAQFQKVSSFITEMRIAATIGSTTWNPLRALNICGTTCATGGSGSMYSPMSCNGSVSGVEMGSLRHSRGKLGAAEYASGPWIGGKTAFQRWGRTLRQFAANVARHSPMHWLARGVGNIAPTAAPTKPIEIVNVRKIKLSSPVTVYNLEVASGFLPEFFANGILVHNSVAQIPTAKLLGIQPAGLNADSEGIIRLYYDRIKAFQESLLRAPMTTIIDIAQMSLWGRVDKDIIFKFKDLWQLDAAGKSAIQLTKAQIVETDISAGVIDPEEGRKARIADPESPYAELDMDDREAPGEEDDDGLIDPKPQTETGSRVARSVEEQGAEFGGAETGGFKQ
jgi:hypothetical protein